MNKPKILFIMHMPPPVHGAAMVGKYIHDSQLINDSFDGYYLKPSNTTSLDDINQFKLKKFTFLISFHFRLIKIYRKIKPDLCYFTASSRGFAFYRDFMTIFILKLLKAKIVVHFHNKGEPSFDNKRYNKFLFRRFFKNIHVIFLAEQLVAEFRPYINKQNIYICPNGIPETVTQPMERDGTHQPFNFFFLSNMMKDKGVWTLLEACAVLKNKGYTFQCRYVGQWYDITESAFTEKVKEFGLEDEVHAYGAKYGEEKESFFRSADAFVFPSFNEALSLVLIEAMEYSLPCITTDVGGIPSIVEHGKSGFIVPPKNVEELIAAMVSLMEHPDKSTEMGLYGRQLFEEKFTLPVFEQNFTGILSRIITGSN
ncbi:MAG: glycosyltransferase family 4 protein [Bacteroidales bacterium]|jgi:glycosyltransferase involved in cell wall biosynthesis|nr:glycosyltransferase family 4 protein [Bacteroidales bacterium]